MKIYYIINDEIQHLHENISEKYLQEINDDKIIFFFAKNNSEKDIVDIMQEEIYGLRNYIINLDDVAYNIVYSTRNTVIKNAYNAAYETLTFYRDKKES